MSAEKAKRATDDVPAHADCGIFTERNYYAPASSERLEGFAYGGAGFDGHGVPVGVVVDAFHRGEIDDHSHVGVRYESFKAVTATRHHKTLFLTHRLVYRGNHLLGRAGLSDTVRPRGEPFIEPLFDHCQITRIIGRILIDSSRVSSLVCRVDICPRQFSSVFFEPEFQSDDSPGTVTARTPRHRPYS